MGGKLAEKLQSQSGASLPLALLLLLTCVLLCAAILAATSGVSGRTAQLAEMDQHYYGATSAMKLLSQEFEGEDKQVVLRCEKTTEGSNAPTYAVKLVVGEDDAESGESNDRVVSGTGGVGANLTMPQLTAIYLLAGSAGSTVDAKTMWENAERYYSTGTTNASGPSASSSAVSVEYSLSHTVSSVTNDLSAADLQSALAADVRQSIYADGSFMLTVDSGTEAAEDGKSRLGATGYRLLMVCEPDINIELADSGQLDKTKTTEAQVVTVSWDVAELEKAGDA